MNWKKVYIYGIGYIILIGILFVVTGIEPSILGFAILFLECIKTPKSIILTALFIFIGHYLMHLLIKFIEEAKDD